MNIQLPINSLIKVQASPVTPSDVLRRTRHTVRRPENAIGTQPKISTEPEARNTLRDPLYLLTEGFQAPRVGLGLILG